MVIIFSINKFTLIDLKASMKTRPNKSRNFTLYVEKISRTIIIMYLIG